ncbi:TPA: hypothetical protein ACH9CE_002054, partial [Streptococcus pneumoniae]
NAKLIQKGFSLLELTEETSMLSHLKKEVETHYQPKKLLKKSRELLDLFIRIAERFNEKV